MPPSVDLIDKIYVCVKIAEDGSESLLCSETDPRYPILWFSKETTREYHSVLSGLAEQVGARVELRQFTTPKAIAYADPPASQN